MIKHSNTFTIWLVALLSVLISCDDNENEGLKTQPHDENEMMTILHNMGSEMRNMTMTKDADHDFGIMMQMHHQGAIEMGNKELEKGNDPTIRQMAETMIGMQHSEIQKLQEFIDTHTPKASEEGTTWDTEALAAMERMDRNADLEVLTGDVDHDMAILMINHHQSAMDMAQSLLHHGHHEELKAMASKMIEDQSMEITDLQEWLLANKEY